MAYDAKKRIHTCATLRKLWDTCQWNHESFTELNTTIPKGSGFYSNCAHEDLAHVYDILHIHKTFLAPMILAAVFSQNSKSQQKANFRGK